MNNKIIIFIILIATILISCNNSETSKTTNEKDEILFNSKLTENTEDVAISQYQRNTGQFSYDTTYPFGQSYKIEIISYSDRMVWDTIPNKKNGTRVNNTLIKNGKLNFDLNKIIDRVTLNIEQQEILFNTLYNTDCGPDIAVAGCFQPRHLIVFYDKNNYAFSYIEICFQCYQTRQPEGINIIVGYLCYEKISDMIDLFKKVGITYALNKD